MARKLRMTYPGALYHVINRGNYRANVFESDGAKQAFLDCLWQAAEKADWRVHAYVVMRNHYHLALETPDANLVEGMRWLQSTYANRFNRFRGESGHVFQGRYHAIVVETEHRLGTVGHYIHLNPVRAHLVPAEEASAYPWSSLKWLESVAARPERLELRTVLTAAGGLADTSRGHKKYQDYLAWLAADEPAQRELAFERMSRGWALGTEEFVRALAEEHKEQLTQGSRVDLDAHELREAAWQAVLSRCLGKIGKGTEEIERDRKAADWKVGVAVAMRTRTTATNSWLAQHLRMGAPDGVSRYVSEARKGTRSKAWQIAQTLKNVKH